MADNESRMLRVRFPLPDEGGTIEIETLWAIHLENNMYKIDNLPFYAYDVSLGDAVLAIADFDEKLATFKNILSKSGNRTIQILFELADLPELSGKILDALVKVGCGYEGANSRYFAVNVPALVDLSAISDLLSRAALQWEQSDPQRQRMRVSQKRRIARHLKRLPQNCF
jgi:hypothetical protein